jgi:hypothetical protein
MSMQTTKNNLARFWFSISLVTFSVLACRPVITIGWGEFLIFAVLLVLLIGPPVYRFLRRLEKSREQKKK